MLISERQKSWLACGSRRPFRPAMEFMEDRLGLGAGESFDDESHRSEKGKSKAFERALCVEIFEREAIIIDKGFLRVV